VNPRIRNFDLKTFFELHFGPLAWAWLNATFVLKAYQETGEVSYTLALVAGSQLFYVADKLFFEVNYLVRFRNVTVFIVQKHSASIFSLNFRGVIFRGAVIRVAF
jgi:hypothetical protein